MTKTSVIMLDDAPMKVGLFQPVIEMSVIPAGSDMPQAGMQKGLSCPITSMAIAAAAATRR